MDSALDFESSGCRFESCQGRLFASGRRLGKNEAPGRGFGQSLLALWRNG